MTISTFLIRQGCDSSSKMTLVGTALNLGLKMKIYPQVTKVKNTRAGHAKLLFLPTKYANL